MAGIPPGPALPWAAQDSSKGVSAKSKQTATEYTQSDIHPVAIDQLGMSIGDRIEVLWSVHPDPPAEPYQRWWGAKISDIVQHAPGTACSRGPSYQLRYDGAPDDGFEDEELVPVQLLAEHSLFDCERSAVMYWRREGDRYEPPDESEGPAGDEDGMIEEVSEGDDEATGGTVSLHQLASGITDADVAASEAEMLDRLADNPAGQRQMAAGYRDFMDNFKAFIAAKASSQSDADGSLLITEADMEEFKAIMQTKKGQQKKQV